ncbi:ribonuclease H-like domain-containing protein [Tanacetum coccineum]|uniref:Ribonuclease H-like domain-containing protein n=1 Tax=Tanacetum coccineum TaxID=301880 RepID=A0ABQ4Z5E3_9ASTR
MITFLKNMGRFTYNQLKNKSLEEIQRLYEREQKWINDFVPMDSKMVKDSGKKDDDSQKQAESSKKRPRAEHDKESVKKQKLKDDAKKEELRTCLDIVLGDDIAINVESLATKYLIADWKTHILTENMMYYQTIRADGSSKNYKIFSEMLDDFDKQDVVDLYSLVKERMLNRRLKVDHESTMAFELIRFIKAQLFRIYPTQLSFNKLSKICSEGINIYNNFKIVEQEVKGTASSSSSLNSQNMAFLSSPSSTNEVNTAYGVSTANTQVSSASTQVSTDNTLVSNANLSDDTVYAFLANQPNMSQIVYEDLEQIHEDDIEEIDLKWQLALLSMRTRRFFQKIGRKITINGSDTAGYNKSKVECFNYHKIGHFARECRGPRNQDSRNMNQDSSRKTINVEETSSKAMFDLSNSGLEEFQQPEFKGYGPKPSKIVSEDISNEVRESLDAPLVKKVMLDNKLEKKTIFPTLAKIEFVRPKQQEKPVRKPVKYAEMYRYTIVLMDTWFPRAVLMKTSLRSLNTTRPVNTAHPKTTVWSSTKINQAMLTVDCSRHMTRNMSYISEFKLLREVMLPLGEERKEGIITSKEDLKTVFDMKNIVLKATLDESMLWHRRLVNEVAGLFERDRRFWRERVGVITVLIKCRAILASSSEVPSVLEFLQRRKLEAKKVSHEVAASEFSHLNHSLSHRPVFVKPDISKPNISKASSFVGKLHILKPSCERNGITPTPKKSLSPTSGSKIDYEDSDMEGKNEESYKFPIAVQKSFNSLWSQDVRGDPDLDIGGLQIQNSYVYAAKKLVLPSCSHGRALTLHARGTGFDSPHFHIIKFMWPLGEQ